MSRLVRGAFRIPSRLISWTSQHSFRSHLLANHYGHCEAPPFVSDFEVSRRLAALTRPLAHNLRVYVVVVLALALQAALSVWYSFTTVGIYVTYTPGSAACATNSCSSGKVAGLVFFATFSFLVSRRWAPSDRRKTAHVRFPLLPTFNSGRPK